MEDDWENNSSIVSEVAQVIEELEREEEIKEVLSVGPYSVCTMPDATDAENVVPKTVGYGMVTRPSETMFIVDFQSPQH